MDNETLKDALEKAVAEREKAKQESLDMAAKNKSLMDELKFLKDKDSHSTPALVSEPLNDVENIAKTLDLLQSTQLTYKNNVVHNVTFNVVVHDTVEVMKEAIMKEHKQAGEMVWGVKQGPLSQSDSHNPFPHSPPLVTQQTRNGADYTNPS